jgi:hypothetical protein
MRQTAALLAGRTCVFPAVAGARFGCEGNRLKQCPDVVKSVERWPNGISLSSRVGLLEAE